MVATDGQGIAVDIGAQTAQGDARAAFGGGQKLHVWQG